MYPLSLDELVPVLGLVVGLLFIIISCNGKYDLLVWPLSLSFVLDDGMRIFLCFLLVITQAVWCWSKWYMVDDCYVPYIACLYRVFVLSMVLVGVAGNSFLLLIGWDGLGVSSFFLVCFYMGWRAKYSGLITVLCNRWGDCCMLFALGFWLLGAWLWVPWTSVVGLLLLAVFTKCAQVPFSVWLPLAIAAPTTISALVHSSTLVVGGVVVVLRLGSCSVDLMSLVLVVGLVTFVVAALGAVYEADLNRLVAISTMSHVSLMLIAIILLPQLGLAHICIHALFNSLLFVAVGYLLHTSFGLQSARVGACSDLFVLFLMVVCALSLCGMVLLSGFWSKHMLYEVSTGVGSLFFAMGLQFGMVCSFFYSVRMVSSCLSRSFVCVGSSAYASWGVWVLLVCGVYSGFFITNAFVDVALITSGYYGILLLGVSLVVAWLGLRVNMVLNLFIAGFHVGLSRCWDLLGLVHCTELGAHYGTSLVVSLSGVVRSVTLRDIAVIGMVTMVGCWVLYCYG